MCTETVERTTYLPQPTGEPVKSCAGVPSKNGYGRRFASDRLRLDVGVSRSGEMYSWAGEDRFSYRYPGEIVGNNSRHVVVRFHDLKENIIKAV